MKKLYLTKQETNTLWNYIGDPLNPHSTLDVGMVTVEDRSEIKVDEFGAYVERIMPNTQQPPTHSEVEKTMKFLIKELNLREETVSGKDEIGIVKNAIVALLLAQKKQIEERVVKAEKEILDYQNNFRAGGATPEATEFGYNIAMDRCLGILAAVKEAL